MGAAGEQRIIAALCSAPRLNVRGYLAVLPTLIKRQEDREIYEAYITDALKAIAGNTAIYGTGDYLQKRYYDMIKPQKEETRTPDEVVNYMKNKLRGGE